MPNYNEAQGVADLLSKFDFNIISEGTTLFTSLTIAEWTQKGDESAKTSPVSLKAAAKEARESSAALAAHGASTIDLEHEADNAQKASETLFDADGDR